MSRGGKLVSTFKGHADARSVCGALNGVIEGINRYSTWQKLSVAASKLRVGVIRATTNGTTIAEIQNLVSGTIKPIIKQDATFHVHVAAFSIGDAATVRAFKKYRAIDRLKTLADFKRWVLDRARPGADEDEKDTVQGAVRKPDKKNRIQSEPEKKSDKKETFHIGLTLKTVTVETPHDHSIAVIAVVVPSGRMYIFYLDGSAFTESEQHIPLGASSRTERFVVVDGDGNEVRTGGCETVLTDVILWLCFGCDRSAPAFVRLARDAKQLRALLAVWASRLFKDSWAREGEVFVGGVVAAGEEEEEEEVDEDNDGC